MCYFRWRILPFRLSEFLIVLLYRNSSEKRRINLHFWSFFGWFGVNDSPALKIADVGVANGAMGSDIAVEAADVALMSDDLSLLPYLKWLSNTTVRTIRSAIGLSMGINFAAVTLSVMGLLNPTTGALVHSAGSCLVVLLAALLYDRKDQ